jgi:NADH-quinone oxidoreductase subunit C
MDLAHIQEAFPESIRATERRNERRVTLHIDPAAIKTLATFLFREQGCRFIIATALHTRKGFEIYYHFSDDPSGLILNLHVVLDTEKPEIESITPLFEAANWIEREMHELFGIDFVNHPNQEKLLSEGNWAHGVYPYRKDFRTNQAPQA